MGINGSKNLGDWGKMIPVNNNVHITQTNEIARDGRAAHITTDIPGLNAKVHNRFDSNGDYLGSNFAKR